MPVFTSATIISGTSGTVGVGTMTWINGKFPPKLLKSVTFAASASADITLFQSVGLNKTILALTGVTTAQNKTPQDGIDDTTGTDTGLKTPFQVESANLGFTFANATDASTITITVEVF